MRERGSSRVGVGASRASAVLDAVAEATQEARAIVGPEHLALVFATPQYPPCELAAALSDALGPTPWAGCTAPRVFAGLDLLDQGVVVGLVEVPGGGVGIGVAAGVSADAREAGRLAMRRALDGVSRRPPGRRLALLLADTAHGSGAEVLRGAQREAGNGVVWVGGGAGDTTGATTLVQLAEGGAHTDSVVAVVVELPSPPGIGVRHGWRPFGAAAMVTRAHGNVADELEYRGAFEVYRETAERAGASMTAESFETYAMLHPLGIPQANGHYLVRDPIALEGEALRCVAEIPDGALVRVMGAEPQDVIAAAREASEEARRSVAGAPAGVLVFDCVSRHLILGTSFEEELAAFCEPMGQGVPLFGCLTYGEIAAFGREVPQFHNKTAVVVALAGARG